MTDKKMRCRRTRNTWPVYSHWDRIVRAQHTPHARELRGARRPPFRRKFRVRLAQRGLILLHRGAHDLGGNPGVMSLSLTFTVNQILELVNYIENEAMK